MDTYVITLDVDWAPDFVIDWVAEILLMHKVKATWFITHPSPAIERLKKYPHLFELGIHPNFLPNSTHGNTVETILDYCLKIIPEAFSMRTHGLFQSSPLLNHIIAHTDIKIDVSLFLPHTAYLHPIEYWSNQKMLLRIPYYWEDDFEMERPNPVWHPEPLLSIGKGLKIFDFHPIHIYLNSANMKPYQTLKQCIPTLSQATLADTTKFIHSGTGTQTMFKKVVDNLEKKEQSYFIRDLYKL